MFRSKRLSKGARAVITGAGSGIGQAFAIELAARGGAVVCSDIDQAQAEVTVARIESEGGHALATVCDVTKLGDVEKLAQTAEDWFGGPADLVINNAGVGAGGHAIGEMTMADWQWVLDINMWGVIHGCHVFAPRLREAGRGGIINVASTASFAAAPRMGAYNASKAAVLAVTETLAAELADTPIRVTALCPTFVQTNIMKAGRISASSSKIADNLMRWTGVPAESVVRSALAGLDRGHLYVLPQFDARLVWRLKRLLPAGYTKGAGFINRFAANDTPDRAHASGAE
ncbi:Short chain dehydrogenase/reductase family oxidoreductase [Salinisphaera dokdonensis CL-ES53]|uniref:Short chain dehydrogenase/reductase family oxidoreductase n=1 Tax=Salinisphaera dokdonensis CL-ES53 TaxID=1304272 RepID=A0ABV2B1C6_9GAMM